MTVFFFVILLCFLLKLAHGQDLRWTRAAGTFGDDFGYGIAVESGGSIYVTGYTVGNLNGETSAGGVDIVLMKYASDGTMTWTKLAGSTGTDYGRAVAVDNSDGSVYVTGFASGSVNSQSYQGGNDIVLLKFSSSGTVSWTRMVGSAGNDQGYGVAVESSTGAVYVVGYASGSINSETYVGGLDNIILKYSSSGSLTWTRMSGTVQTESTFGVAVDSTSGSVYVCGYAGAGLHGETFIGGSTDGFIMKYASDGTRSWTRMAGSTNLDTAWGVAVDSSGAVYMTGYASAAMNGEAYVGGRDIFLVSYSSAGTRLWTRTAGVTGEDEGKSVVVDSAGSIFVAGYTSASLHGQTFVSLTDMFLMKYSSNGTRVWTRMVGGSGSDQAFGVAVYGTGHIYLVGYSDADLEGQILADISIVSYTNNQPPTMPPTVVPTVAPTPVPTRQPTGQPSRQPSGQPSRQPTRQPTSQPTRQPSSQPSAQPSFQPSRQPTNRPTSQPSQQPTNQPTSYPTTQPTDQPNSKPTTHPSSQPTSRPTTQPTDQPTSYPTAQPSCQPTAAPTTQPSSQPTRQPSCQPTMQPSSQPSSGPTAQPTMQPTSQPSRQPIARPSSLPTTQPSVQPSRQPVGCPSAVPTRQPSGRPTSQPSITPTGAPSGQPASDPTGTPSLQPSAQPTASPTVSPDETVCRYQTFVIKSTQASFKSYRCFRVPGRIAREMRPTPSPQTLSPTV